MPLTLELWDDKHSYPCHVFIDRNNLIIKFPPKVGAAVDPDELDKISPDRQKACLGAIELRSEFSGKVSQPFINVFLKDLNDDKVDDALHPHIKHMSSYDTQGYHAHMQFKEDITNDIFQSFLKFIEKYWSHRVSKGCLELNSTIATEYFAEIKMNKIDNMLKPSVKIEQQYREEKRRAIEKVSKEIDTKKRKEIERANKKNQQSATSFSTFGSGLFGATVQPTTTIKIGMGDLMSAMNLNGNSNNNNTGNIDFSSLSLLAALMSSQNNNQGSNSNNNQAKNTRKFNN